MGKVGETLVSRQHTIGLREGVARCWSERTSRARTAARSRLGQQTLSASVSRCRPVATTRVARRPVASSVVPLERLAVVPPIATNTVVMRCFSSETVAPPARIELATLALGIRLSKFRRATSPNLRKKVCTRRPKKCLSRPCPTIRRCSALSLNARRLLAIGFASQSLPEC